MKIQTPAATWAQIGLTRLALRLIVLDAIVLIVATSLYAWLGLRLQWSADASAGVGVLILLLGLWLYYHFVPGTATEHFVAEVIFVFVLSITFVNIVVLSQYARCALRFPYADWWLAAADERLGIHVPALVRWTTQHTGDRARSGNRLPHPHARNSSWRYSVSALFASATRCGNSPFTFRCAC